MAMTGSPLCDLTIPQQSLAPPMSRQLLPSNCWPLGSWSSSVSPAGRQLFSLSTSTTRCQRSAPLEKSCNRGRLNDRGGPRPLSPATRVRDVTIISPASSGVATEPRTVEADRKRRSSRLVIGLLALCGPGLVVMLADTDAGSLILPPSPERGGDTRWSFPSSCSSPSSTSSRR